MPTHHARPTLRQAAQSRLVTALPALVGLVLTIPTPSGARAATRRVLEGERVAIHNLVGSLEVVPGSGSSVVAEITLSGQDANRLRVEQGPLRGRSTLRIVYPGRRIKVERLGRNSTSNFWVREDGTLDGKSGEGHRVQLNGRDGIEASADVKLHVPRGAKVEIYWGHGMADVRDIDADLAIDGAGLGVTAVGTRGALSVDVASGTVRVSRARGAVNVETGSGQVQLDGIQGATLSAETGSGAVRASDIDCPELTLETGSGDIEALDLRARRASLQTGSGNVEVLLDTDIHEMSVESGSGNVRVLAPRGFGAEVYMQTGSGVIETDLPIEVRSRSKNEVTGTLGDGRGRLHMETGSGNISIRSARR